MAMTHGSLDVRVLSGELVVIAVIEWPGTPRCPLQKCYMQSISQVAAALKDYCLETAGRPV